MKQKGHAFLIGLLIAAAVGGYLIYSGKINSPLRQDSAGQVNQIKPTPVYRSPDATTMSKSQNDETVNWKTYTSTKYKFSFKYPPKFHIKEYDNSDGTFNTLITDEEQQGGLIPEEGKMRISVFVGGKDFKRTDYYYGGYMWTKSALDTLLNIPNGAIKNRWEKMESVNIDTFIGVKYKITKENVYAKEKIPALNIALMKGDRTFLINTINGDLQNGPYSEPYLNEINKILSTFKFTK